MFLARKFANTRSTKTLRDYFAVTASFIEVLLLLKFYVEINRRGGRGPFYVAFVLTCVRTL